MHLASSRRASAGAAIGVTAALILTGCKAGDTASGGGTSLSAAQVIERTSQKAKSLDTFAADISETGTADGKTTRMAGTFKFRSRPSPAVSADFRQLQFGGQNVSGSARVVLLDDVLYLNVPVLSPLLGGGRPWFKVSLAGIQHLTGVNVANVVSALLETTPSTVAGMFTASRNVGEVGTEMIDGVRTTHFRGSVSVRSALSRLDAKDRDQLGKTYGSSNTISFDLWVDAGHLPRRTTYRLEGTDTPTSTTIDYHYGERFRVSAPPADQVGGVG